MTVGNGQEFLCMRLGERRCLIDYKYVVEICSGMKIERLPGLPSCFCGICDYKGTLLPVVDGRSPKSEGNRKKKEMLLIVSSPGGKLGILAGGEACIMSLQGGEWMQPSADRPTAENGLFRLFRKDGQVYYLIEVPKLMEIVSERPN